MKIGYARTSTVDQIAGLEAQMRDLALAGCEKVFDEQVSSVDHANRAKLAQALEFARAGDALVVTKLDRLARSVGHLLTIVEHLEAKGVTLQILNLGVDTSTPTGRLMLTMLGGIAQFEREIMLERQREGIAKAKADGKYQGRKPTDEKVRAEVLTEMAAGKPIARIAREKGLSRTTVYKIAEGATS